VASNQALPLGERERAVELVEAGGVSSERLCLLEGYQGRDEDPRVVEPPRRFERPCHPHEGVATNAQTRSPSGFLALRLPADCGTRVWRPSYSRYTRSALRRGSEGSPGRAVPFVDAATQDGFTESMSRCGACTRKRGLGCSSSRRTATGLGHPGREDLAGLRAASLHGGCVLRACGGPTPRDDQPF
jgi:hypothetical protein